MRLCLVVALVTTVSVVTLTDLDGRSEVGQSLQSLAATNRHLAVTRSELFRTQEQTEATIETVEQLESSTLNNKEALTNTNHSITTDEAGIFFDGIDISTLNGCLVGVTQSLDQIAVGQVSGAFAKLNAVATACSAVRTKP